MDIKIEKLDQADIIKKRIKEWPIWEKGVSQFDWYYDDTEECLILEGHAIINFEGGSCEIKEGDFVTFPQGLSCKWEIKQAIKKHYNFK